MRKDYFWNTLGVFLQNAISPLLLIVITRINGIDDSGLFSFAFSVSIIFWAIGMWGGRTYQVSDVKQEFSSRSYVTVRLVLSLVIIFGALIFSAINQYDATKTHLIVALVAFKAIESIADSLYGILQVKDRLYVAGKSLVYKSVAGLMLFTAINWLTQDIVLASISLLLINIVVTWFYDIRKIKEAYKKSFSKKISIKHISDAFIIMRRCLIVFIVSFLATLSLNIPRYFVDRYWPEEIGYFGIIAMPITLIVLLMSFILQPNIVNLSRLYGSKNYGEFNRSVYRIITVTTLIGLSVFTGAYIAGVPILNAVFGVEFEGYKAALLIVLIGGTANALVAIFINLLTIMRQLKPLLYVLFGTSFVLVLASLLLIQTHGLSMGVGLFMAVTIVQVALLFVTYTSHLKKISNE